VTWSEGIVIAERLAVAVPIALLVGAGAGALLIWFMGANRS